MPSQVFVRHLLGIDNEFHLFDFGPEDGYLFFVKRNQLPLLLQQSRNLDPKVLIFIFVLHSFFDLLFLRLLDQLNLVLHPSHSFLHLPYLYSALAVLDLELLHQVLLVLHLIARLLSLVQLLVGVVHLSVQALSHYDFLLLHALNHDLVLLLELIAFMCRVLVALLQLSDLRLHGKGFVLDPFVNLLVVFV